MSFIRFARFVRLFGLRGLLGFAIVMLAALVSSAQEGAPAAAPAGGVNLEAIGALLGAVVVALLGLWAVGRDLVNRMAARPVVDGWDRAKAVVDRLEPYAETLARIADPKDPMTAPTPDNPTGAPQAKP